MIKLNFKYNEKELNGGDYVVELTEKTLINKCAFNKFNYEIHINTNNDLILYSNFNNAEFIDALLNHLKYKIRYASTIREFKKIHFVNFKNCFIILINEFGDKRGCYMNMFISMLQKWVNEIVMFYDFINSKVSSPLNEINIDEINIKTYVNGFPQPLVFLLTNNSDIKNHIIINSLNDKKILDVESTLYINKGNIVGLVASSMYHPHDIKEKIEERLKEIIAGQEKQQMETIEEYDGQVKVYYEW